MAVTRTMTKTAITTTTRPTAIQPIRFDRLGCRRAERRAAPEDLAGAFCAALPRRRGVLPADCCGAVRTFDRFEFFATKNLSRHSLGNHIGTNWENTERIAPDPHSTPASPTARADILALVSHPTRTAMLSVCQQLAMQNHLTAKSQDHLRNATYGSAHRTRTRRDNMPATICRRQRCSP